MTTSVDATYAVLSAMAYEVGRSDYNLLRALMPNGATYVDDPALKHQSDPVTGFEASAFSYDGKIVISFAGTLIDGVLGAIPDLLTDGMLSLGLPEQQIRQAAAFYQKVKAKYGDNVVFTGHSLGGGLAALMGVFFNKPAITLDPAPFRLSATQRTAQLVGDYLATLNFAPDGDLTTFTTSEGVLSVEMPSLIPVMLGAGLISRQAALDLALKAYPTSIRGESNIVAVASQGEFLTTAFPPFTSEQFDRLRIKNGPVQILENGAVGALGGGIGEGFDLHSVTLLCLLATHPEFELLSKQLPSLIPMLFDKRLYATSPSTKTADILVKLLQNQYASSGAVDVLGKLSSDLSRLVSDTGTATYGSVRDALIVAGLEYYHLKTDRSWTHFFNSQGGALHFKYSDIGAASYKSLPRLAMAIGDLVEENIKTRVVAALKRENAWHIQQGAEGMTWTESATQNDAAIGGSGVDLLDGGVGNDVLLGGVGSDVLKGGRRSRATSGEAIASDAGPREACTPREVQ